MHVHLPAALRELGDGRSPVAVDVGEDATIAELLDALGTDHPAVERRIRDEQGRLRTHVNLFVGDENVRSLGGAGTVLRAGDEVSVLAAISGG